MTQGDRNVRRSDNKDREGGRAEALALSMARNSFLSAKVLGNCMSWEARHLSRAWCSSTT